MQGWEGIVARLDGPVHFRFIMQPLVASVLAIIDGIKDAKMGKHAYFWALIATPGHRWELIKNGWKSIGLLQEGQVGVSVLPEIQQLRQSLASLLLVDALPGNAP
jgi:hypothetical protein